MSKILEENNDLKKVLILLNNVYEISEFSLSASEYYTKVFEKEKLLDEIELTKAKYEVLSLLDKAIKNFYKIDGKNEKAIALINSIQVQIASIKIDDDNLKLSKFRDKCNELSGKLELIEERYGGYFNQKVLTDDKLDSISNQINDLINEIKDTEIDKEFKRVLMDELLNMQYMIKRYNVYGNDVLQDATYQLFGKFLFNIKYTDNATEPEKTIFRKIIEFVSNVNHIIKFGENVVSIASTSSPILLALLDKTGI